MRHMRRMRGLLVALVAAVLELLVVIGSGNQWVTQRVADKAGSASLGDVLARSANGFGWRFAPVKGASTVWQAELAGIGALVVVTFLLVLVLAFRASRSFFGTVFGVWGIIVLASVAGAVVREVIGFGHLQAGTTAGGGRFADSLAAAITYTPVVFGVASGLLVGLITAIVAVATARRVEPAVVVPEPERDPDLWTPESAAPWQNEAGYYPPIYPETQVPADRAPVEFAKAPAGAAGDDPDRTSAISRRSVTADDAPDFDDELSPAPAGSDQTSQLHQPTASAR